MQTRSARPSLPRAGLLAGTAAAGLLVLAILLGSSSDPRRVPELTVVNPSPFQVNVEISTAGEEDWLDLGAVGRERSRTVEELPDLGGGWVFRFSSGGIDGGRLELSRAALDEARWSITVPSEVIERFAGAGLRPSAE